MRFLGFEIFGLSNYLVPPPNWEENRQDSEVNSICWPRELWGQHEKQNSPQPQFFPFTFLYYCFVPELLAALSLASMGKANGKDLFHPTDSEVKWQHKFDKMFKANEHWILSVVQIQTFPYILVREHITLRNHKLCRVGLRIKPFLIVRRTIIFNEVGKHAITTVAYI